ncbi:MAG: acetyl-CoA carboxylase biotin carboxylase subunit family protein [Desulfopila sp.]
MVKNIFVAGLDEFHFSQLLSLRDAADYRFYPLMSYRDIKCRKVFPVRDFLHLGTHTLRHFAGTVDGVIGYLDFPISTMLPIIQKELGFTGPTLEAILKCEHKYWSRCIQAEAVADYIPPFQALNPFSATVVNDCHLTFPFWLKPVKSVLSHLGFIIHNETEFEASLQIIREQIWRYADPFNFILGHAELPDSIAQIDGSHCIAEGLISSGRQCTLEGYVHQGHIVFYGCIDSIRGGHIHSSFSRYQYPSTLSSTVQQRMQAASTAVLEKTGLDNTPFNIEFYWDEETDTISLLEINPRISKSHCPLFKMVDGEYHLEVVLDIALGRKPRLPHRQGRHNIAAKFMLRSYRDGTVTRIPSRAAIERLKQQFPGFEACIKVQPGTRLSHLLDQDSYSYEIAEIFMGAANRTELEQNYQIALANLPFSIEDSKELA